MSTQKWPDDDLDDLFRKSAEESDPAYNPAAWQDLKARLNDRDRTLFFTWAAAALLLLLVVSSLVWYVRQPDGISRKPALTNSKPNGTGLSIPASSPKPDRPVRVMPDTKINDQSVTTMTPQPADTLPIKLSRSVPPYGPATATVRNREKPTGLPAKINQPGRQIAKVDLSDSPNHQQTTSGSPVDAYTPLMAPTAADRITRVAGRTRNSRLSTRIRVTQIPNQIMKRARPRTLAGQSNLAAGRMADSPNGMARQDAATGGLGRHRSEVSGLVTNRDVPGNGGTSGTGTEPTTANPAVSNLNPDNLLPATDRFVWETPGLLRPTPLTWSTPTASMPEPVVENSRTSLQRPARPRLYGLSIQAVLSPDLSTIGLRNFDRPGSNIGVMIQYQLSDRFSVQAGALWSTKLYTTLASEYVWPTSGGMTVWPESITGKCTMFDIPVNLRYDVLLRPGGAGRGPVRWFVSGGATSYFIDREVYDYNYANPDDPAIKYRHWDNKMYGRKGGSFGLSNINVSVGYEHPISRRLSWQIEPFMKIPVQQIGYFKVRLLSTGAFVSLRYHL